MLTRNNYIRIIKSCFLLLVIIGVPSCKISYKLNGAYIDYNKVKSISIADFQNVAELVYPPLAQQLSETIRDQYSRQTRLSVLKKGGDMHLEGEVTEYRISPLAISADSYAAETKLTMTVKIRYANNKSPEDDIPEKTYSVSRNFSSSKMLTDVQDELITEMSKEIAESIYNDTVGKW